MPELDPETRELRKGDTLIHHTGRKYTVLDIVFGASGSELLDPKDLPPFAVYEQQSDDGKTPVGTKLTRAVAEILNGMVRLEDGSTVRVFQVEPSSDTTPKTV